MIHINEKFGSGLIYPGAYKHTRGQTARSLVEREHEPVVLLLLGSRVGLGFHGLTLY